MDENRKMKEGFYFYRNKTYYGSYDENQVSGQGSISIVKPEDIRSDHPVEKEDRAVQFWENHCLLEPEYTDLQTMLLKMRWFMNLNTEQEADFSAVEERFHTPLPKELKQIYTAIYKQEEYLTINNI